MKKILIASLLMASSGVFALELETYDGVFLKNCNARTASITKIDWKAGDQKGTDDLFGGQLHLAPGAEYFVDMPYVTTAKPSFAIFSDIKWRPCFQYRPYKKPAARSYQCGVRGNGYEVRVAPDKKSASVLYNGKSLSSKNIRCSVPEAGIPEAPQSLLSCAVEGIDHGYSANLYTVGDRKVLVAQVTKVSIDKELVLATLPCESLTGE